MFCGKKNVFLLRRIDPSIGSRHAHAEGIATLRQGGEQL